MKITPRDIARSLIDTVAADPKANIEEACISAIALLKKRCPGITRRSFLRLVEREMKRRGLSGAGLLVVPNDHSIGADVIIPALAKKSGKTVHIDRLVEPEIIGGAVLLIDHKRIDCSIQGALAELLQTCLQPLD